MVGLKAIILLGDVGGIEVAIFFLIGVDSRLKVDLLRTISGCKSGLLQVVVWVGKVSSLAYFLGKHVLWALNICYYFLELFEWGFKNSFFKYNSVNFFDLLHI